MIKPVTRNAQLIFFILSLLLSTVSFAQEFTAKTIGDYGNVTVMEVTGNYDAKNPDGSWNDIPRQAIAKEFLKIHKDEYDFLVIFSNFDFQMPETKAKAFYLGVKNDTQGIGKPIFDNSALFGSNGKLQGMIDMGNIANLVLDFLDPKFEETLSILAHEKMHRWGAHVRFRDSSGNISTALLGRDSTHWSFLLNSKGSVLYGNHWQDNGNGTFTSIAANKYYSPLDLYLMGFNDRSQVPPMLLIENPGIDPIRMPEIGTTISGTPRYITIDDIIVVEGERVPGPSVSQKTFKTAFILITEPGTFTGYEIYGIENVRNGFVTRFSILTDGQGLMQAVLTPKEDIPINPGILPPPVNPRTIPPNIEDGVKWLMSNQRTDGTWMDLSQTIDRDTAEAVLALRNFTIAQLNYSTGLQWLNGIYSGNMDYLSRKIEALKNSGQDVSQLLNELLSRQNTDGGWGSNGTYRSNPVDTAFALNSLSVSGYSDSNTVSKVIEYLKSKQNADGGWGSDDEGSTVEATANVLSTFNKYRNVYQLEDQISRGITWLLQKQYSDGGFGNSPSTVYDTAISVLTLREFDVSSDVTNKGINYILNLQSNNGSWYESPYQTALAIQAVWKATVDPDLSIKTADITFIPPTVKTLPSNIVINADIWNSGRTGVPQAKVVLYDGEPSLGRKLGEQTLAFAGQSSTTVTFSTTITDGNEHKFYISVDPENLVKESNETNNIALNILKPEPTYDFEILPTDITVSQSPVDIFKDVKVTSKITNKGTMNAYNVQIKYYIDETGGPFDIATETVNMPANSTITNEIIWHTNKAGENLPITVYVDSFDSYTELSETNNQAVTYLTVNGSTEPNLTISYKDLIITPNPVNERGSVNISALVKNEGFSKASNITVNFYKGVPGVDGILLGSQTISSLNASETSKVSIDWINIMESGERIIYVQADPENQIKEIKEDDNDAFTTLRILSLPDFAISTNSIVFSPPAPKDGDTVAISVTVKNLGEQGAINVPVNAYEGSTLIGSQVIPLISGNSQEATSFTYNTTGKSGTHQITVIVDPDNSIIEQSEDNNTASRTFGVQDANLWLTEKYISPNGDNIKDSTQFFFRLNVAQTVKIVVVNKKDEVVRTFTGAEFENTTGSNITWDGLNDDGMVVDDGQYQVKTVDLNNTILGSLLVIVDNNRSPLTDAIGTKYLLNNNLTCMLPNIYQYNWNWFPNESGMVFSIEYTNQNTPEYPTGLYTMAPDGEDILRLIPWDWSDNNPDYRYSGFQHYLSPDGEKVAFIVWKSDRKNGSYTNELWVEDIDGRNLTLLEKSDIYYAIEDNIKWSPDGKYIAYIKYRYTGLYELWIINISTLERIKISAGAFDYSNFSWSPDNNKIAYTNEYYTNYNQILEIWIADTGGNANKITTFTNLPIYTLEWLNDQRIFLSGGYGAARSLWLVDISESQNHVKLSDDSGDVSISPDMQSLAFATSLNGIASLNIADTNGNAYVLHEIKVNDTSCCIPYIESIIWSPDGREMAFVGGVGIAHEGCSSCTESSGPYLVVVNMKTKKETSIAMSNSSYLINWFSDGVSIIGADDNNIYVINSVTGETVTILASDTWGEKLVSPLERYITYHKEVNQSSVCYGRGWQDIWAISSLFNLTADLRAVKNKSSIVLKGIAADLNFEGYQLEYADVKNPNQWNLVKPPSDVPVINDVFTTWVPPYEGTFYVRLTVWDKAGNVAWDRKRVSWGLSSSITNLYKSREIFSPNGDGVKDTVELHYRVLEPVHLEFNIYDENNNLLRTFLKDYTSPVDDFIIWDGRDSSGRIVPDGKYKIKVFDYEFFIEVDNTPPDVGIHFKNLVQDYDLTNICTALRIYAELEGHVIDNNFKNWIIEYGEGDNPQEWYEYKRGEDQLVKKDKDENAKDVAIEKYYDYYNDIKICSFGGNEIEFLVGKKFKIAAEDFGGNRNTAVTDLLEERLIFDIWDGEAFSTEFVETEEGYIFGPKIYLRPRLHSLGGIETIRLPIVSINVQYLVSGQWFDASPVINPPSGEIDLRWDNSNLNQVVRAIRIKAIDIMGYEHYSNIAYTESAFWIDLCNRNAWNFLYEKLEILRFQVRSNQDARYTQWTNYTVYEEDLIPSGIFQLEFPPMEEGLEYKFRMIGIGISGEKYIGESRPEVYPPAHGECGDPLIKFEFILSVDYNEADCGLISGRAVLTARIEAMFGEFPPISLKTLSYYIEKPEGIQLLRQFDLTKEGWGSVTVDTSNMPEGSYPVKAVLTYLDLNDNTTQEITATNILIVDRVLPTAQITYPGKSLMVCPIPQGNWFGIPVEGIAEDNTNVKRYELYYGIGENPSYWMPAMTKNSKGESVPITGGSVKGQLGLWDVTNLKGTTFTLKLKVVDFAGNVSCYTTSFNVDNVVEIVNLTRDKSLFSPNGDGVFDDVKISYEIDEYAVVDVKVFKLIKKADDSYALDSTPVRTIVSGLKHLAGTENTSWDGKGDSGSSVPDGKYGIAVFAKDSCGNTRMRWVSSEIDNTPPTTVITYPRPPDPLGNIVEIKGTAEDLHFQSYILEAGQGDNPDSWVLISSNTTPVKDNIVGKWNTFGLNGKWTLRLTATDTVGNKNITSVTIDLGARKNLIKDLDVAPKLFSPNNDGKLDTTNIKYELTDACQVKIDILDSGGVVKRTYTTTTSSAGTYTYTWDGKDNAGVIVSDGAYTVKLTATLSSNTSVTQTEAITVTVDSTPPTVDIKQPLDNSYIKTDASVNGTISDKNLLEYSINYTGDSGTTLLDQGNQNRENYTFGILNEPPEGKYTLNVKAKDLGENITEKNITFTIDRTPPKVILDTPKEGEYYGSEKNIINITGSIVEKNLEIYSLRYGSGENPAQWIELQSGNTIPTNSQLFPWKVGKNDGIPDGLYTLSLFAKDKAGLEAEVKIKIKIDNTPPEVSITSPKDGDYVKASIEIKGTAYDLNLDKYTLELSEGQCSTAFKWGVMKISTDSVKDGILTNWQALPPDGNYCLRLTAIDKLENKAEAKVNVKVDTHPPAAPVLLGKIESKSNARLSWTKNAEPDLDGYNLYRDNQKVNTELIKDITYLDQSLKEGVYTYTVKAVDLAGNESDPSNEVKLKVDLTGPDARIRSPQDGSKVSGLVEIKGTAYSADDFKEYRVYIGQGSSPSQWNIIRTSPVPISYGILSQWDTIGIPEGSQYSIKLEAEDINSNINTHQITVTIDNTPPSAPLLISAIPNGSDVDLTWKANTEPDLAGYLLYRNDQLANVTGIVIGDLKPYLITGTTYLDKTLPDGKFKYYLIAMDQAGNMSDQSNTLEVDIDTHPPKATIVEPLDKSKFEDKTLVKAESPDLDIASVQFQYKKTQDTTWINLGIPVTQTPYITYLDPITLGMSYGDYNLRAVATDYGAKTDPSPSYITVTYTDLTSPDTPIELKALTNGKDVTLIWKANTEADLDGYNIYRTSGATKTKVNTSIVKDTTYQDKGLSDGTYTYEVTTLDTYGNESKPSNSASAKIYAPSIEQPYTPTGQKIIKIKGSNSEDNSTVEIFVETVAGSELRGTTTSDAAGNFTLDINLTLGENRITAKATDSAGNISRASDMVVVVYNEPPSAPTGLAANINGYDVTLTWNPNTEQDLSGYNLYRDGEKVNVPVAQTSGNTSASSSYYNNPPSKAFDSDSTTYWMSNYSYGTFIPVWWEIDLPSPELINHIEIQWESESYAGKDYEIRVWSGYAWITQTKVTGNNIKNNIFDFKPSYRTDRIRIYITDTTDTNYSKQVRISEVKILKDNLITESSYNDANLDDDEYSYRVTAVDYYGFESLPSNEVKAIVGDVIPPSAPLNLTASSSGSDIILNWTANIETDLAGYNIYRNTPEGWIKINTSLTTETTYTDANLPNGTYSYRATAVDTAENESLPSNEASAVVYVADMVSPDKPVLFYPTVTGLTVTFYTNKTDISGFAEPASMVELFKDGIASGQTYASNNNVVQTYNVDPVSEASLSPNGKMLAYSDYDGSLWLHNLSTGAKKSIIQNSYSPLWSPDGNRIANIFMDANRNDRIGIYDVMTETNVPLTSDAYVNEFAPSWSSDGIKIAFISNYNVWIKDFVSGSIMPATNGIYTYSAKISPDGRKVAYFANQNLYMIDLLSGNTSLVDGNTDGYTIDWVPDNSRLLFISYMNGNNDIYSYDISTTTIIQITNTVNEEFYPIWSPDGKSVVFSGYANDWTESIWTIAADGQGNSIYVKGGLYLNHLSWIKSGAIGYVSGNTLSLIYPEGYFNFKDVSLNQGENLFHAVSTDSSGNVSQPSDAVTVIFDTALMPDLETTTDDIYIYPPYPITGEEVAINVVVWNKARVEVRDVEMDLYLWDSSGNLELLKSENIPYIASNSGEVVGAYWNSASMLGINTVIAVIDPHDKIHEFNETNNFAMKEMVVTSAEGISMTTTLDRDKYQANQDVNIHINLKNSGIEKDVTIETSIEDENGNPVATFNPINTILSYATQRDFDLLWSTGSTYAGSYRVHTVLRDTSGILSDNIVPFTILSDISIDSAITTDKTNYGPRENVFLNIGIKNTGKNYIIPELIARVKIEDSNNSIIFTEDRKSINLLPDVGNTINSFWNTGLTAPGIYNASVEIYIDNQLVSTKTTSFTIDPIVIITGSITATPSVVIIGNTVQIDYIVKNSGNINLSGLPLKAIITDPESQGVMNSGESITDLQIDATYTGQFIFSTQGYDLKNYLVILQYSYQGNTKNISSTSFTVRDGIPPVVNIISPISGSYYNSKFDLAVTATDDASGVDRVEYQIDGGTWKPLPVSDLSYGRYLTAWSPVKADEGVRTISFRATDKAGNTSLPVSTNITIDLTPPAPPIITSPSHNSFVSSNIVDIKGIAEPGSMVKMVFAGTVTTQADPLTGEFIFKGVRLNTGQNIFIFTAEDRVGNISGPTGYTLHLDISAWLSGTITASPNPVYQGKDETVLYTITNKGYGDINNLNVKVVITDSGTSDVKQTFEKTVNIPANTTITGNYVLSTTNLLPKTYLVVLNVFAATMPEPKTLASTSFELKPGIEVTKRIPDVMNLLVWVNDECEEEGKQYTVDSRQGQNSSQFTVHGSQKENDHDHEKKGCVRIDLLENILRDAVTSYFIVYDKKDFERELRDPYYTDILILGDHHPLEDHYPDELREQVYSGRGLISVLYLKHGEHHEGHGDDDEYDPLFGIRYKGHLSWDEHQVNILDSQISGAGTLIAKGEALKVEVDDTNRVVAWIADGKDHHKEPKEYSFDSAQDRPGIVLNTYGLGKTIFYAFDLGLTLDDTNYNQSSTLIKNSITYVHRPQDITTSSPNQLIPVEITIKSLGGAFNLRITETYPAEITIYDPITGQWITDNPWTINIHLEPNETKTVLYYALTPDTAGTYTLKTEVGYMDNGTYNFYQSLNIDIVVDKDAATRTTDIITALKALSVSGKEKSKVDNAIKYIENVQKRVIRKEDDIEKNIYDIIKAIDSLLDVTSIDISNIRLMMDELLKVWESRYYLGLI